MVLINSSFIISFIAIIKVSSLSNLSKGSHLYLCFFAAASISSTTMILSHVFDPTTLSNVEVYLKLLSFLITCCFRLITLLVFLSLD